MKKVKTNYVNNKQLYEVMKTYHAGVQEAKGREEPLPRVPEYVGQCLLLIATRLATKPNFYNYSYIDEMISDGIETALLYINNFDPQKSQNPFAYFTQIIRFSFIRRIEKEKKQQYIKIKNLQNFDMLEEISGSSVKVEVNQQTDDFVRRFEEGLTKKRKDANTGITKFLTES